jgi:methylated-DNA-[protein]-cysteine S-methyltransferase
MSVLIGRPDDQVIRTFFPEYFRKLYRTPDGLDDLLMTSDGSALTGLRFARAGEDRFGQEELPLFKETACWLDRYFQGRPEGRLPDIRIEGLTPFRSEVLRILRQIPFGETVSYGGIAREIAQGRYKGRMSAQAVGQAVGWNPVCIMIPCHRVLGADGSLTGYGGGLHNKRWLLKHEGVLLL